MCSVHARDLPRGHGAPEATVNGAAKKSGFDRDAWLRDYRARLKRDGRCVDCPALACPGMRRCLRCKLRHNDKQAARERR